MKHTLLMSWLLLLSSQWQTRIAALQVTLCDSSQAGWKYELFAVVAHSGSSSCGHYCAYIRSLTEHKWYCFNDSEVCQVRRQMRVSFVASWTLLQISFSLIDSWLKRTMKENKLQRFVHLIPLLQRTLSWGQNSSSFCTKQGLRFCFAICRSSHLLYTLLYVL